MILFIKGFSIKFFISFVFLLISPCFAETFFNEMKTPITTEAKNPFLIGAGLTLTAAILEDQVVDPLQEDTSNDRPLGSFSKFGDLMGQLVPNIAYYGAMKTHYYFSDIADSNLNAEIMLKATFYSALVTNVLKYTIREPRPNGSSRNSFPSGHTTSAFAFASAVGAIHGWKWGIPAYVIAGFVGFSRINDNAHYLHDVLGGAAIGLGYGLGITYLLKKQAANSNLIVYPLLNKSSSGIRLVYNF